jgi:hypothetical protein
MSKLLGTDVVIAVKTPMVSIAQFLNTQINLFCKPKKINLIAFECNDPSLLKNNFIK